MSQLGIIFDFINGFRRSKVLFSAVKLGVFEVLKTRPMTSSDLATAIRGSSDGLDRLLHACAGMGLLTKDATTNTFALNQLSQEYLLESSPSSFVGYICHSNDVLYKLWGNLDDSVKTGTNCWQQSFGFEGSEVFTHLYNDDAAKQRFVSAMHSGAAISADAVATAFDLSKFKTFVDLGGATGALTVAVCKEHHGLNAIVFDLLPVLKSTEQYMAKVGDNTITDRIKLVGGDFFEEKLPEGDVYGLSRILHDWPDHKCSKLLKKVYDHLPPGGAVLICEMLLNEDKMGPEPAVLQSLNMLVQTEGKERTLTEYTALLHACGFIDVQAKRTAKTQDAILAYKPL